MDTRQKILYSVLGTIALLILVVIWMSVVTIDAGNVGVKKVFGSV